MIAVQMKRMGYSYDVDSDSPPLCARVLEAVKVDGRWLVLDERPKLKGNESTLALATVHSRPWNTKRISLATCHARRHYPRDNWGRIGQ